MKSSVVILYFQQVARALTLRTLGSVAGIIPERQQVHHSIRRSLDSHDSVEVEAAIYAAKQFAAQSKYVLHIIVTCQNWNPTNHKK
jgi:hypothetical protein